MYKSAHKAPMTVARTTNFAHRWLIEDMKRVATNVPRDAGIRKKGIKVRIVIGINHTLKWYVAVIAASTGNIKIKGIQAIVQSTYKSRATKNDKDDVGEARIVSTSSAR